MPETVQNIMPLELSKRDMSCLHNCANEVCNGYASDFLQTYTATTREFWDRVFFSFGPEAYPLKKTFSFTRDEWETIYQAVNAVIYELGPEELTTLTGYTLEEMATFNRKIFCALHGRYISSTGWDDCDEY